MVRRVHLGGAQEDVVPIRLTPVGGSSARGGLTIIRIGDQPAVDLDIRGLKPTRKGETYVLWFVGSGGRSLPVAFQAVGAGGRITGQTPIPERGDGTAAELRHRRPHPDTPARGCGRRPAGRTERDTSQPVGTSVLRGPLRG